MNAPDFNSPDRVAAFLRRYNEWRRNKSDIDALDRIKMPAPSDIGRAIDAAVKMLEGLPHAPDCAGAGHAINEDARAEETLQGNPLARRIEELEAELAASESRLHEVAVACATAEQERDAMSAELQALREQKPVAWYCDIEDWAANTTDCRR